MPIKIGDTVPTASLTQLGADGPEALSTADLFSGKTVIVFGVPGAFTPTCSEAHLPGFLAQLDALKAKGVDTVACITVNDPFVVTAWAKAQGVNGITMLCDGNADYVSELGMDIDMSARGFGIRSSRFAMIVKDGTVAHVAQEAIPKDHGISSADAMLVALS